MDNKYMKRYLASLPLDASGKYKSDSIEDLSYFS